MKDREIYLFSLVFLLFWSNPDWHKELVNIIIVNIIIVNIIFNIITVNIIANIIYLESIGFLRSKPKSLKGLIYFLLPW